MSTETLRDVTVTRWNPPHKPRRANGEKRAFFPLTNSEGAFCARACGRGPRGAATNGGAFCVLPRNGRVRRGRPLGGA